jgi:anaerobic selenocysteine-containing dehydrogenase
MAESDIGESKRKKVLRRDFLAGGGAAIAAGALGVGASASVAAAATPAQDKSYAPSTGYLVYDSRLCLGCQKGRSDDETNQHNRNCPL